MRGMARSTVVQEKSIQIAAAPPCAERQASVEDPLPPCQGHILDGIRERLDDRGKLIDKRLIDRRVHGTARDASCCFIRGFMNFLVDKAG
jgi:hypothetical protein